MTAVVDGERERIHEELKEMFVRRIPRPGKYATAIKGLTLSRRQEINKADSCFGKPSVALVVQESKRAGIGERVRSVLSSFSQASRSVCSSSREFYSFRRNATW